MRGFEADSIDAVVTDPPYGLVFMNKHWDSQVPSVELWREVLRVLKPGGHVLSFGGTRTYHRMAAAIEDAGFEIRDQIQWLYGSGFPKSLDVSKAIDKAAGAEREVVGARSNHINRPMTNRWVDSLKNSDNSFNGGLGSCVNMVTAPATDAAKEWQGWGSGLKPAHEPIVVARKPFDGPLYKNVLKHGTGGLNIDASRIATTDNLNGGAYIDGTPANRDGNIFKVRGEVGQFEQPVGRWPANVILSCSCEFEADQMRLVHDEDCPVAMLDKQSGLLKTNSGKAAGSTAGFTSLFGSAGFKQYDNLPGDTGGASRFFYVAKSSKAERNRGLVTPSTHPTVKPIKLMEYLIRMITPPGGLLLDPFAGSGSTGVAAKRLGFSFIGIEREQEYADIARARIGAQIAGE